MLFGFPFIVAMRLLLLVIILVNVIFCN